MPATSIEKCLRKTPNSLMSVPTPLAVYAAVE
jgi:hypothetical protein